MAVIKYTGPPPTGEGAIFLGRDDVNAHMMMLGATGAGRRSFVNDLMAAGAIAGHQVHVVEIEPTEEELRALAERERTEEERRATRLASVRDAYWDGTAPDSGEWSNLHDSLTEIGVVDSTAAQWRVLFNCLSPELIGLGISWGFTDSVVRDDIHQYALENREFLLAALAAHEGKEK